MVHKSGKPDKGEQSTDHTKLERDASAGWREEFRHQHADPDIRADGGRGYALPAAGERVVDREDDEPDVAIVLKAHATTTAREHYVEEIDATVAEANPEYDPLSPVVVVAFVFALEDERRPGEEIEDVLAEGGRGAPRYSVPAPRLEAVEGGGRRV